MWTRGERKRMRWMESGGAGGRLVDIAWGRVLKTDE